ncbi:MAG: N-6 DNA methylase [Myxococcota bacterium]|nr:N-6 DNA methylase [Myxococcota bacterium]
MASTPDQSLTLRELVLAVVQDAGRSASRMAVRGEGTERDFRSILRERLLVGHLGWDPARLTTRERFDLLLFDDRGRPLIYIETKAVATPWTKKDEQDFRARLPTYASLQHAYLTNGISWLRLDLFAPNGIQRVGGERTTRDVAAASDEAFDELLRPLRPDQATMSPRASGPLQTSFAFDAPPVPPDMLGRNRSRLSAGDAESTRWFTQRLTDLVSTLTSHYVERFAAFREGRAGVPVVAVTRGLFEEWCRQSLIPSPRKIVDDVRTAAGAPRPGEAIAAALRDLGFVGAAAARSADAFAAAANAGNAPAEADEALWTLLGDTVAKFAGQTAHVVIARLLLYRVGEDKGLYERLLSGIPLKQALDRAKPGRGVLRTRPAIEVARKVRERMEEFLPTVYLLGSFDWWPVLEHMAPDADPEAKARLAAVEDELEKLFARILDELDSFELSGMDFDVWRAIYQHYLPDDERQRLGGFYTPEELVELVLDAARFESTREGLCRCTFVDPASGSGAFVVAALRRFLAHLELDMPCHADLHESSTEEWSRAERIARLATGAAHAVDIHPFAAFLTTINVLFQILPHYVRGRHANPELTLPFGVFTADSLELPEAQMPTRAQDAALDPRIRQAEDSARRYREKMTGRTFDFVFGNPPWGGVLKGPLAPVFDEPRKDRLRALYPASTDGKFDVFGPFMEHAVRLLRDGGRFALVTQGSYLDKGWAGLLRQKLSSECRVERIVDFNPFGQLLFRAMNIPCVTVGQRAPPDRGHAQVVVCGPAAALREVPESERKAKLMDDARAALRRLGRDSTARAGIARGYRLPHQELARIGTGRWPVGEPPTAAIAALASYDGRHLLDLVEAKQGVTPGGALDIFLMRRDEAQRLNLGEALVRRAVKSRDLGKWRAEWDQRVLLYPYRPPRPGAGDEQPTVPAFHLDPGVRGGLPIADALDFETPMDDRERAIVREHGMTDAGRREMLEHRIAAGLVQYREVARYLTGRYERLSGRVFKKKNIREFSRRWYEYLWPRNVSIMLRRPRILCPGLAQHVRFVLDTEGYLSDHAAFLLLPTERTSGAFEALHLTLASILERSMTKADVLRYIMAFANSSVADELLRHARRPRPGEVYQYDERFLREIPVPDPLGHAPVVRRMTDLVDALTEGRAPDVAEAEAEVDGLARSLMLPSEGGESEARPRARRTRRGR